MSNYIGGFSTASGPGSSVGIATGYGSDGRGIESRWGGEIFRTYPDQPWGPPSFLYNGYRVFPGGKNRPGLTLTPQPLLVPWPRKSRAIPLFPYGSYGLHRASVPVEGCNLTLPFFFFSTGETSGKADIGRILNTR